MTETNPERLVTHRGSLLATDADREAAAAIVRQALAEGSLTVEEADERLGETYAARRHGELQKILVDLPQNRRPKDGSSGHSGRIGLGPRLAAVVALCALGAVVVAGASASGHAFWPLVPLGFLTMRVFWWRGGWRGRWASR
jgi:hypothetical protein